LIRTCYIQNRESHPSKARAAEMPGEAKIASAAT